MPRTEPVQACPALAPALGALPGLPRRVIERVSAMGFRHLQLDANQDGLRPRDLGRSGRRDLAATLRRASLVPIGIDAWIPPGHFLDPGAVDEAITRVVEAVGLAADLGSCPVSLTLPAAIEDAPAGREVIAALLDAGRDRAVVVVDHGVPPLSEADIGAGIDPAAWLAADKDPVAVVTRLRDRLVSARLSDLVSSGSRVPIGDGGLDVRAYRVALATAGFRRPVVLDARGWRDPWPGLARSEAAWRG